MNSMKGTGIWRPILIFLLVGAGLLWAINFLSTGNPLWFSPVQPSYAPDRIVIYSNGEQIELTPGEAAFTQVEAALNTIFSDFRSRALISVGLGPGTVEEYQESGVIVVAFYPEPVQFNLPVRMRDVNTLLVPVVGRHSDKEYVFMGKDEEYLAGALQVTNRRPLDQVLRQLGYLSES